MSHTVRNDTDFSLEHKAKKKKSFVFSLFSTLALLAAVVGAVVAVAMIFFLKDITATLPSYQYMLDL